MKDSCEKKWWVDLQKLEAEQFVHDEGIINCRTLPGFPKANAVVASAGDFAFLPKDARKAVLEEFTQAVVDDVAANVAQVLVGKVVEEVVRDPDAVRAFVSGCTGTWTCGLDCGTHDCEPTYARAREKTYREANILSLEMGVPLYLLPAEDYEGPPIVERATLVAAIISPGPSGIPMVGKSFPSNDPTWDKVIAQGWNPPPSSDRHLHAPISTGCSCNWCLAYRFHAPSVGIPGAQASTSISDPIADDLVAPNHEPYLYRGGCGCEWCKADRLNRQARDRALAPREVKRETVQACPDCAGTGEYRGLVVVEPCTACAGKGRR